MIAQLAAAALLASQVGAAAGPGCIAQQEADDLLLTIVPDVVDTIGTRCGPFPGSTPFIASREARAFVERARAEAAPRLPGALRALETITGRRMPGAALGRLAIAGFVGMAVNEVVDELTEADCRAADRLVRSLAPLPSANIVSAFTALILLTQDDEPGRRANRTICTDEQRKTSS